ncbi:hypothetical protein ACN0IV_12670 [Trabulsiella odontotermitis]|uniref:hypothetical protein n=1 Tax=Trabulsiella odontotermitis TaxID=379893 RepID=UPI003AC7B4F3
MAALPVKKIIPAYPFVQYRDDPYVTAFFTAFNEIAQGYMDDLNNLYLPCWTSPALTGDLLDWAVLGIYGEQRPLLQLSEATVSRGIYNTIEYNAVAYNAMKNYVPGSSAYIPDDYFKRILTWNFYKGDGEHFSIDWLKRRIARFIHGPNGIDPPIQNTFDVSVTVDSGTFSISIPDYGDNVGYFLKNAIDQSLVKLPFIYIYSTTVVEQ